MARPANVSQELWDLIGEDIDQDAQAAKTGKPGSGLYVANRLAKTKGRLPRVAEYAAYRAVQRISLALRANPRMARPANVSQELWDLIQKANDEESGLEVANRLA